MKSIRLSLTVYFLILLAGAVGAASLLAYRSTERTLEEREAAARVDLAEREKAARKNLEDRETTGQELAKARYVEECHKENERLDNGLLKQARAIHQRMGFTSDQAKIDKFHRDYERWARPPERQKHQAMQLLAAGLTPTPASPALLSFWTVEASRPQSFPWALWGLFYSSLRTQITLRNFDPLAPLNEMVSEYFQINTVWGAEYLSKSLKGRRFAFDRELFHDDGLPVSEGWDDVTLEEGKTFRRVWMIAPAAKVVPGFVRGSRPGMRRPGPPQTTPPPEEQPRPAIYIQYACETTERDKALEEFATQRQDEFDRLQRESDNTLKELQQDTEKTLADLHANTVETLADTRTHLLLIGGLTFVAVIGGAFFLVRLGLAPLHRLSDAVSRVTEKDFRLQLSDRLPTELQPIADRLAHTLVELKRAFEREKQATADISHDLRTPLSALLTTIDVTLRKPRQADEYREALEDCRGSAQQINQIVERLLSLARLDAGVDRIRRQSVDATRVAEECVTVVRPLAEARGIRVSLDGEQTAALQTDPDKLREILNNLLHNAIEYNRPNGKIDVAVQRQNGHVRVVVRDTGIGISETARAHIFERFFRADPSREADGLHAGLGLAIVKGYVDLMGGRIDVDSVEGEGSTFSVCLPAA